MTEVGTIGLAAALYVLGTIVVMGFVPRQELVKSVAPFSEAARILWGPAGELAIAFADILSSIGALNGWTLLMGQVPMVAARDGLFPEFFGRLSPRNVPATGIVASALLATLLVLVQAAGSEGFASIYRMFVGLSTMTAVVPYAFCALASSLVSSRISDGARVPRVTLIELIAFAFAMFTLCGCGAEPVLFGLILLLSGIPVFIWRRRRNIIRASREIPPR